MFTIESIESLQCSEYLAKSSKEVNLLAAFPQYQRSSALIVTQGFEERSIGVLEAFAEVGVGLSCVVINRYSAHNKDDINGRYKDRFETAAERVAPARWSVTLTDPKGTWLQTAVAQAPCDQVIVDITGISNKALFTVLDVLASSNRRVSIAYSEAEEYWPKHEDWKKLKRGLSAHRSLAEMVDEQPWLFASEHNVQLIPGHEGYDSAVAERALIGFLPFKHARLAAVLGEEDYSHFVFIAGKPRLKGNHWRLSALKEINRDIVKDRRLITMPTFGYRDIFAKLSALLLEDEKLLEKYNIHLAILGSKLQVVACWLLSSIIPSITIVTSVPTRYYPQAFSEGIGAKWIFPLIQPKQ